jgi:hypothetical protein
MLDIVFSGLRFRTIGYLLSFIPGYLLHIFTSLIGLYQEYLVMVRVCSSMFAVRQVRIKRD